MSLPSTPFEMLIPDPQLPPFPRYALTNLVAFADAAYATDTKTCRSVSGYVIVYAGAAVAYKAKMQLTVATSSTEAKFIAAVYAAKAVKHCNPSSMIFIYYHQNQLLSTRIIKPLLT